MSAIRLQRYLAQAGVCARRKAEELIVAGRVAVNGERVVTLGTKVTPGVDRVAVDGEAVYPQELFYALLNKPKGCITAVSDPHGRPTVMDYLRGAPVALAPVGRLDYYTEGVLLLTNDGELAARLLSSRHHVEKTYHVKLRGQIGQRDIARLREGVRLSDDRVTRGAQVDRLESTSKHDWLVVTLIEGRSRQIHRMLEALGHTVVKLQRVAFAGLAFHGLRVGDARELTQAEVNALRELVGLPRTTVSRGVWTTHREDTELGRRARARARQRAADEAGESAPSPRERAASPRERAERSETRTRAASRPARAGGRNSSGAGAAGRRSSGDGAAGRKSSGASAAGRKSSGKARGSARSATSSAPGGAASTKRRGPSRPAASGGPSAGGRKTPGKARGAKQAPPPRTGRKSSGSSKRAPTRGPAKRGGKPPGGGGKTR